MPTLNTSRNTDIFWLQNEKVNEFSRDCLFKSTSLTKAVFLPDSLHCIADEMSDLYENIATITEPLAIYLDYVTALL